MSIAIEPRLETGADFIKLLHELGDIDPARVRMDPLPGTVTFDMFLNYMEEHEKPICEWVHNTIVEKTVGAKQSILAWVIGGDLYNFLTVYDLGLCYTEAGMLRILTEAVRAADVAFVAWDRFPDGDPEKATDNIPEIVPNLVIEVLSDSNRKGEMRRKRENYFQAGVELVWEINPKTQTAKAYTDVDQFVEVGEDAFLDGGTVLPSYQLHLNELFARAAGKHRNKPETES